MTTQSSHLPPSQYRPDIDGLRAIAVLTVVTFHAFPNFMKGGFIGVDVFFVISGFLISGIIFQNLEKERFIFSEFYSRRIKRIFPALSIVLLTTHLVGWFILLADEYKNLGKNIAAGAAFISNFILWKEAGYFDTSAETKPLLHLWSLGIEEQFYILWPFLAWLAWKKKIQPSYYYFDHHLSISHAQHLWLEKSFRSNILFTTYALLGIIMRKHIGVGLNLQKKILGKCRIENRKIFFQEQFI